MLVITNGLTGHADEGFLKVANHLVKRMKTTNSNIKVASYGRQSELSDRHFKVNKLLLNPSFLCFVQKFQSVLYIPFPAKTLATALRIFILSLFVKRELQVILVMKSKWNYLARKILWLSKAKIIVLSKEAYEFYQGIIPDERLHYIKTGVDTERFCPVETKQKQILREKYGLQTEKPVILHVGHLKQGRNVGELLKISDEYQIVLVTSTLTAGEQDLKLKEKLKSQSNVLILEEYMEHIEEIYQMADVYFFPTIEQGNCIDVPLSCLEAASCNKPLVTTAYGEMREFRGKQGFYFLSSFEEKDINNLLEQALQEKNICTRSQVLSYDWNNMIKEWNR